MRHDHTPYWLKKAHRQFELAYAKHFLYPQFDAIGEGAAISKPWNVEVVGANIRLGRQVHILSTAEQKIRICTWKNDDNEGRIDIGDYVLITPGARITSLAHVTIGANTMLASHVYITDADWHDTYDRTVQGVKMAPVVLGENVWIGDSSTICKGVTIGENSIIGARSVVVEDIPPNVIAAGNPAKVVKPLDPDKPMTKRSDYFADPQQLADDIDEVDRYLRRDNTFLKWLRTKVAPTTDD